MKSISLLICLFISVSTAFTQVVCAGVSPASIAGNYNFSWSDPANGWSSPDFNVPGTSITGELILVDDGSVGNSPASGLPLANYGCATLVNTITGKIAVVYRYDGVTASTICWMSDKAKFAQDAGAIAVVVVNRPGANEDLGNGGGTAAGTVTIPVVMISFNDGATLRAEMLNGPVTMFLGNKTGLFADDIGVVTGKNLISTSYGVPSVLAQNGTDFNFDLGTRVFNYGTNNQSTITVTANVDGPGGTSVFSSSVGPITLSSGDSIDIFPGNTYSFLPFSLFSYAQGTYTLTYNVSTGGTDGYPGDNLNTSKFIINDSIFSYAKLDPVTNKPISTNGYRPATNNSTYSTCMVIDNPNASKIGALGLYFSASTAYGSGVNLTGEEIAINLYSWNDVFADLNDANLAFNALTPIAYGYYYFPSDLQAQTVYAAFNTPVLLQDNQRYLACAQTVNTSVYLGHDLKTDYTWNESHYLQPLAPNESDGTYYASGFGMDKPSAIALQVCSYPDGACTFGLNEESSLIANAFPNPSEGNVTISLKTLGAIQLFVSDITGRLVLNQNVQLTSDNFDVNISSLESGLYIFSISHENGKSVQFSIEKK